MKRNTLAGILIGVGATGIITSLGVSMGYNEDVSQQTQVYEHVQQLEEGLAECKDYMDSEKCIRIQGDYNAQMSNPDTSKALYDYGTEMKFLGRAGSIMCMFFIPLFWGVGMSIKPKEEEQ